MTYLEIAQEAARRAQQHGARLRGRSLGVQRNPNDGSIEPTPAKHVCLNGALLLGRKGGIGSDALRAVYVELGQQSCSIYVLQDAFDYYSYSYERTARATPTGQTYIAAYALVACAALVGKIDWADA